MQPANTYEAGDEENWNLLANAAQSPSRHHAINNMQAVAPPGNAEASKGRAGVDLSPKGPSLPRHHVSIRQRPFTRGQTSFQKPQRESASR